MTKIRECMHDDGYPAEPGKRKCIWHILLKMPIEEQIAAAEGRRAEADSAALRLMLPGYPFSRMGKADWPAGERFCAGCQGFVPLFYCTGSRCKAHNALAAHSGRLESTYGIDREIYVALLALQDGKCYVCGQYPRTKRLAVDHDHKTGEVRGLLCADVERGCNHAVLGSLEARSVDGVIAAAYRLIDYMTKTPYQRLKEVSDDPTDLQRSEGPSGPAGRIPEDIRGTAGIDHQGDLRVPGEQLGSVPLPDLPEAPELRQAEPPDWVTQQISARG